MKRFVQILLLFFSTQTIAQVTTDPVFFTADQPVTITYDATQGNAGLVGLSQVFMHAGVITTGPTGTTWTNVVGNWGNPASPGQMTNVGPNVWQITITPRTYFNVPAGTTIYRLGMVFREAGPCGGFGGVSTDCRKGGTAPNAGDIFVDVFQGGFDVEITEPTITGPIFKSSGETIAITANSSIPADLSIKINNVEVASATDATLVSVNHVVAETGLVTVAVSADNGTETVTETFEYIVRAPVVQQVRPAGVRDGINYIDGDPTRAILSFWAPQKSNVYLVGDFNDWTVDPAYLMKQDGERFWHELTGLTSGTEYAYQFLVDENLFVADPFCDKILDPNNDQFIASTIYPNLKPYPTQATGIVSVLQTGQTPYVWQVNDFVRPDADKLNVYELLVRDFDSPNTYQSVINRLDYLQALGINAIELMPIMEFSGNISWGYNPIFYMAADKAYGTKNKLKELIDEAHKRGMAVILDMVLNQADYEFPYVKMYWDNGKPAATSPWFNRDATHPFNVFFDFNHESPYTQTLVDTINRYWLGEYRFDGYRFDLSKGFTQTQNTDVGAWSAYDQSRVDILKRMADRIWEYDPTAYVMLEHLGVDSEERELANYGMMLWGKMTENYKQNALGFSQGSDLSRTYHRNREGGNQWTNKASIVAYMESHDEQRIMYDNLNFGNSVSGYNVRNLNTALERMKAAHAFLLGIPGPKMIWQFGEVGYEFHINRCENGTINNDCRTSPKPIRWDYLDVVAREKLYRVMGELFKLRNTYSVFHTESVSFNLSTDLYKRIELRNSPYTDTPASPDQMNVVIIGNFDVTPQTRSVAFPHAGTWYHYFSNEDPLSIPAVNASITLQPGEFRIYTDVQLPATDPELMLHVKPIAPVITALTNETDRVRITWSDNSTVETGYRIFRRVAGGTFASIGQVNANFTQFADNNVNPTTTYEYYVEAFNTLSKSSSSIESITTPDLITNVKDDVLRSIIIYPNPTHESFRVMDEQLPPGYQLTVRDMQGRIIPVSVKEGDYDIRTLAIGIYIIEIANTSGERVYHRLLKQQP